MKRIKSVNHLGMLSRGRYICVQVAVPGSYMWLRISKKQAAQVLREVKASGRLKLEGFENEHSLDLVVQKNL